MKTYILLDRSGSMIDKWQETISAVNTYANDLKKNKDTKKSGIDVYTFDQYDGVKFEDIRRHNHVKDWKDISDRECMPRGGTPLYDAIGRLSTVVTNEGEDKAVVVVITDGHENASSEYTKDTAKKMLDALRAKNYQIVFLGASFDNFDQARDLGNSYGQTMTMAAGTSQDTMASLALRASSYGATGQKVVFSDQDRKTAKSK